MSSIKDALRVIAAEGRIEDLAGAIDRLDRRMTELDEKLDTMIAVASQPRPAPAPAPAPRPIERR